MTCAIHHRHDCGCYDLIFGGIVPASHPPAADATALLPEMPGMTGGAVHRRPAALYAPCDAPDWLIADVREGRA